MANELENNTKRSYKSIRSIAQKAEKDGFDSIWLADHLIYRDPGEPDTGIWECWTVLSALAEATRRVEIRALVICNSFRNPAILAKMATTADEVSNRRIILGIGAGWNEPEYEAFGLPFDRRVDRLEEALQIIKPLLHKGHVDFNGKYYQVQNCDDLPRGPRLTGPPLMVGGEGPRMIRLAAKYGDLWNTGYMGGPETMADRFPKIQAACATVGRDIATLGVTAFIRLWFPDLQAKKPTEYSLSGTPLEIAAAKKGYEALGVQHIMFQCSPYTEESRQRLTEALQLYRRG
jgi:alkanesulfonate monooxygenase SsuD/methylene tetrahydromethanopterin reductase-like flavin-dependent oxidoreductase (luciferase family)